MNPHFVAYCNCMQKLNRLDPDCEEAEELLCQMDFHWYRLNAEEIAMIPKQEEVR
jgi:hypothetical protein